VPSLFSGAVATLAALTLFALFAALSGTPAAAADGAGATGAAGGAGVPPPPVTVPDWADGWAELWPGSTRADEADLAGPALAGPAGDDSDARGARGVLGPPAGSPAGPPGSSRWSVRPLDRTPLANAPLPPGPRDLSPFLPAALAPFLPPRGVPGLPGFGTFGTFGDFGSFGGLAGLPGVGGLGGFAPASGGAGRGTRAAAGPSACDSVDLASGAYRHRPPADLSVKDPLGGPDAFFARAYSSATAQRGYQSPGLAAGWTHPYDVSVKPAAPVPDAQPWQPLTLVWPGAAPASPAEEPLAPLLDASGRPTGAFAHAHGTPYRATGAPDLSPAAPKGQWRWLRLEFTQDYGRLVLAFAPAPADAARTYRYRLARVARMVGAREVGFTLVYGSPAKPDGPLSALVNDAGLALLTFEHDPQLGFLRRVTDRFGRTVLYQFGAAAGTAELLAVSPVLTPSQLPADGSLPPFPSAPPAAGSLWPRWQYAYERIEGQPRLTAVAVPDASAGVDPAAGLPRRYAAARVSYDPAAGFATARADANGNRRAYEYLPAAGAPGTPGYVPPLCRVTVTDRAGGVAHRFARIVEGGFKDGGTVDAFGHAAAVLYGDGANPLRPSGAVTAAGRTFGYTSDAFGRLTRLSLPRTGWVPPGPAQAAPTAATAAEVAAAAAARHTELRRDYAAPADPADPADPRGALLGAAWAGPGGERGPALGLRYGPDTAGDPASAGAAEEEGLVTALVWPDARRLYGRGNREVPVTTTLRHTALGQVAAVTNPAPEEPGPHAAALGTVTTAFAYTTAPPGARGGADPYGSYDPYDGFTRGSEVFGEPLARTDPLGRVTRWRWDERGNCVAAVDPEGHRTDFAYDAWDRLIRVVHPATGETGRGRGWTEFAYALPGLPDAPVTEVREFDESGRLVARRAGWLLGPEGEVRAAGVPGLRADLALDAAYRVTLRRDASGRRVAWAYDAAGLLREARQLSPAGEVLSRSLWPPAFPGGEGQDGQEGQGGGGDAYDPDGLWLRRVDGAADDRTTGGTVTALWRAPDDGRVLARGVTGPGGEVAEQVAFDWDPFGHLAGARDRVGVYSFPRDGRTGRPLQSLAAYYRKDGTLTDAAGCAYGYYPDGRLAEVVTGGLRFGYSYDAAGRLVGCGPSLSGTRAAPGNTRYAYSPADRLAAKTTWVSGALRQVSTGYRSDARGRLVGMAITATDCWGVEKPLARLSVTLDALGDPVRIAGRVLDPRAGRASLAPLSRAASLARPPRLAPFASAFGYDAAGRLRGDGSDFSPSAAFEGSLGEGPGGGPFTRLAPDAAGNWLAYGSYAAFGGLAGLAYDGAHRPVGDGFAYDARTGAPTLWRGVPLVPDARGLPAAFGPGLAAGAHATAGVDAARAASLQAQAPPAAVGGGTLRVAYRFDGLVAWTEDALGRRTAYAYDARAAGGALPVEAFRVIEAAAGGGAGHTYAAATLWGWGADGLAYERFQRPAFLGAGTGGGPRAGAGLLDTDAEHVLPVFDPLGSALFRLDARRGLILSDGRLSGGGARKAVRYRPGSLSLGPRGGLASTDPASGWRGQWGYLTDPATGLQLVPGPSGEAGELLSRAGGGPGSRWYDPALGRFLTPDPGYLLDPSPGAVLAGMASPYAVDGGVLNRVTADRIDPYAPFSVRRAGTTRPF
jgi:YD repeat-containing protein